MPLYIPTVMDFMHGLEMVVKHFTGLTAPFEAPTTADLVIETDTHDVATAVEQIIQLLMARGF